MTLNQFSREMSRRPFRPFTMVLADGRSFTVDHPEFALIDRRGREVTFVAADNTRHEIDTRLISEIVAAVQEQPAGDASGGERPAEEP
jgi:hypothetical protein